MDLVRHNVLVLKFWNRKVVCVTSGRRGRWDMLAPGQMRGVGEARSVVGGRVARR